MKHGQKLDAYKMVWLILPNCVRSMTLFRIAISHQVQCPFSESRVDVSHQALCTFPFTRCAYSLIIFRWGISRQGSVFLWPSFELPSSTSPCVFSLTLVVAISHRHLCHFSNSDSLSSFIAAVYFRWISFDLPSTNPLSVHRLIGIAISQQALRLFSGSLSCWHLHNRQCVFSLIHFRITISQEALSLTCFRIAMSHRGCAFSLNLFRFVTWPCVLSLTIFRVHISDLALFHPHLSFPQ